MKKILNKKTVFFILLALVFSVSAVFAYSYLAQEIGFTPNDPEWNVDNTKDALDELRTAASKCELGCPYKVGSVAFESFYSGIEEEYEAICYGRYKLEVWGAQGGNASSKIGGYGGYSEGVVLLSEGDKLYINVGEMGDTIYGVTGTGTASYNGGGTPALYTEGASIYSGGGGGATHIAKVSGELKDLSSYKGTLVDNAYYVSENILIVAAGGGGAGYYDYTNNGNGGSGGGMRGVNGASLWNAYGTGASQTAGGKFSYNTSSGNGVFGRGATNGEGVGGYKYGGAGGGGFYGGGANGGGNHTNGGGGGSGYIASSSLIQNTSENIINKMYCYECEESNNLKTYTVSTYGTTSHAAERNSLCPNGFSSKPVSECAKEGNGYVRITYLGRR